MYWQGRPVTGSEKSRESQFNYLMQLLLHGRNGVSWDILEEVLFGDRDVGDMRHALRTIIYNARRRLREFGLPEGKYIERRQGVYFWTEEIPVREDAAEFERLCGEAKEEKDPERSLSLCLEAIRCYTGEFLGSQSGMLWVAREARRYREMFCACVKGAAGMLRDKRDYQQMADLGVYAAMVNPLADWETVTMEALVAMGRYEEAQKLYDETVDLYFREQGMRPSRQLMLLVRRLGTQMEHGNSALDEIQRKLSGEPENGAEGYLCPYPVFQGIYRVVKRMTEQGGQSAYLMLCTAEGGGRSMGQESVSGEMAKAILDSVRRSDAVTRYGRNQYLILLVNINREDCRIVWERIRKRFSELCRDAEVRYCINAVDGGQIAVRYGESSVWKRADVVSLRQ